LIVVFQAEPDKVVNIVVSGIVVNVGNLARLYSCVLIQPKTQRATSSACYEEVCLRVPRNPNSSHRNLLAWARRLIARETREAAIDVLARVLQTPGGRRYWGFDSQAAPDVPALMREIETHAAEPWNELFPWWNDGSRTDSSGGA
jgi:hypothetical protein